MAKRTDVLLITGFLGSGKTTLLNRLIEAYPAERRLMVLLNEFGEIGIDGRLLPDHGLDLMEISKGSIFCVCVKTDFIKALAKIACSGERPDLLLIEATGVANPADLKRDLRLPLFRDRFRLKEQICLIDVPNFMDIYDAFASVEQQLESSTCFVLNKVDLASTEQLAAVRETLMHHGAAGAACYETSFANVPATRLLPASEPRDSDLADLSGALEPSAVEQAIEALLKDPERALNPPDPMISAVYDWTGSAPNTLPELVSQLPPKLLRAKGFLRHSGRTYLFNWVPGHWQVEPIEKKPRDLYNRIVFVGPPEALVQLADLARKNVQLARPLWSNPMGDPALGL